MHEKLGDHAGDFATVIEHRLHHDTHETDAAAAIDEAHATLGEQPPEPLRGPHEGGIGAGPRAAEHAQAVQVPHRR